MSWLSAAALPSPRVASKRLTRVRHENARSISTLFFNQATEKPCLRRRGFRHGLNIELTINGQNLSSSSFRRAESDGKNDGGIGAFQGNNMPYLSSLGHSTRANAEPPHQDQQTRQSPSSDQALSQESQFNFLPYASNRSANELEQELLSAARERPSVVKTRIRLFSFYRQHPSKPNALHYEAMILANCDARDGSAQAVAELLAEMENEGIAPGPAIFAAIIKVLSVHPDPIFRTQILNRMSQQWISPDHASTQFIIAGHIREGQLELALQQIKAMHTPMHLHHHVRPPTSFTPTPSTRADSWLYALLIDRLCSAKDFPAVQQFIYFLEDERVDVPRETWLRVLDSAAAPGGDVDLTSYVWWTTADPKYIDPTIETCHAVLKMATGQGDARLLDSVGQLLASKAQTALWEVEGALDMIVHDRSRRAKLKF